jgi:hypothetical protein
MTTGWQRSAREALLALAALSFAVTTQAQAPATVVVDPKESPLRCLVVPATPLAYPAEAIERKVGGVIRVRMTFTAGDRAPKTEVFYDSVGSVFRDEVLDRVSQYRLPCLAPDQSPLRVTQEFQFDPGDGRRVATGAVRDSEQGEERLFACSTGMDRPPEYPRAVAAGSGPTQGTVIVRFEVIDIDAPPRVEIVFDGGNRRFANVVRTHVTGYRFPCLGAKDLPLKVTQLFRFHLEGDSFHLLKDASLATFVGALDHLDTERVRFDLATMGCPFDLRFTLRRPYMDNAVAEIERHDPNRRELVEWLRRVEVRIPESARNALIGDSMTISVPCGVLDLL